MISPSAPAATPARAMDSTHSQWPVPWLGDAGARRLSLALGEVIERSLSGPMERGPRRAPLECATTRGRGGCCLGRGGDVDHWSARREGARPGHRHDLRSAYAYGVHRD